MWFFAGENVTLNFDFKVDGEFVVPSSASWIFRLHNGVQDGVSTPLTGLTTSASIEILASRNQLTVGSLYENRFVLVNFIHNGRSHTLVQTYKLASFVPITAVPGEVRRLTGLVEGELPDQDIDLMGAYFKLFDAYGTDFSNQLVATTYKNRLANEAIALQAAIDVAISFPLRVPQSVKSEDSQFIRTSSIDWAALEYGLRRQLQENLTAVISVEETLPEVFSVATPTDPVTGA